MAVPVMLQWSHCLGKGDILYVVLGVTGKRPIQSFEYAHVLIIPLIQKPNGHHGFQDQS